MDNAERDALLRDLLRTQLMMLTLMVQLSAYGLDDRDLSDDASRLRHVLQQAASLGVLMTTKHIGPVLPPPPAAETSHE